jgi:hypothetical protein
MLSFCAVPSPSPAPVRTCACLSTGARNARLPPPHESQHPPIFIGRIFIFIKRKKIFFTTVYLKCTYKCCTSKPVCSVVFLVFFAASEFAIQQSTFPPPPVCKVFNQLAVSDRAISLNAKGEQTASSADSRGDNPARPYPWNRLQADAIIPSIPAV